MQLRHQVSMILEGRSKSWYDELSWSRMTFRIARRSYCLPVTSRTDVAAAGSCALHWLMFNPIPRIAKETLAPWVFDSMRIPPSLKFPRTRSLGHFSLTSSPVASSRAVLVTTAARNCNKGSLGPDTLGLRIMENHSPPLRDFHLFRPLPLPFVCTSATTVVHSGAPC